MAYKAKNQILTDLIQSVDKALLMQGFAIVKAAFLI